MAGKTALVTGGSRGIGRAISLELARLGANVAINYFRNPRAARETAKEIGALGVRVSMHKAHVGDPEQVEAMFREVQQTYGSLDILVNNAASGVQRSALELETKHWDWTLDINARGPWLCTKAAVPLMAGRRGRVVNISSLGSQRVMDVYMAVGVSKAALEALTRYLAVELAPWGITVNCVSGGIVATEALEHFPNREEMLAAAERQTPAGRMVTTQDIAHVVAFLCSDEAQMIVGQTIVVDGGMSLVWTSSARGA
ncbi:MAG: enoyl-[acyl-carrier-protein] reductase FabL [Chloroflexi bacterium]|nr:enoyl-[acyl-carrier-protein] reductase FabL [Chloroflexota bacterium]